VTSEVVLIAESFTGLFIEYYIYIHDVPLAIISDRDIQFQSTFWKMITAALGTKLWFFTTFYPNMDSLAEEANDTVQIF
jgi:hypothetical protein